MALPQVRKLRKIKLRRCGIFILLTVSTGIFFLFQTDFQQEKDTGALHSFSGNH